MIRMGTFKFSCFFLSSALSFSLAESVSIVGTESVLFASDKGVVAPLLDTKPESSDDVVPLELSKRFPTRLSVSVDIRICTKVGKGELIWT